MFLDTSGLYCAHDRADERHEKALSLLNASSFALTHSYVLAEFVALTQARKLARAPALDLVSAIVDCHEIEVVWGGEILHRCAMTLLRNQLDKTYSLCDAVSFLLMRQRGIVEALTTDRHFEQAGFTRLL